MPTGRWDHLADQKPLELKQYVLEQVADELARDLRAFPPALEEWSDAAAQARYREVIEREGKPPLETYRVACEIARLELLREFEAIDAFFRGDGRRALLPNELEERSAHFVTRYLVESALAFQEWAKGKFGRADLVQLVEKVEDRLLRGYRLRLLDR
ncbi:MAG: hypothetical protein NVSMB23_06740 [Myxococcales bacterium]